MQQTFTYRWLWAALLGLGGWLPVQAQNNAPIQYGSHFPIQTARFAPSKLGDNHNQLNVNLMNMYVWTSNNFANYNDINNTFVQQNINTAVVQKELGELSDRNHLGVGVYFQPISVSFKFLKKLGIHNINNEKQIKQAPYVPTNYPYKDVEERFTVSLEVAERIEANFYFSKQLGELVWYGNGDARFLGRTVNIGGYGGNFFYQREIALGFAMPIEDYLFRSDRYKLRIGGRLKYIMSMANVYNPSSRMQLTTNPATATTQSSLLFDINYRLNSANSLGRNFDNIDPLNLLTSIAGHGMGIDLGGTFTLDERLAFTASLLDVGFVSYSTKTSNYSTKQNINFDGVAVTGLGTGSSTNVLDSLSRLVQGVASTGRYTTPLPTRLAIQAEYRIPGVNRNGIPYFKHQFFLTYTQGFLNYGSAITRPNLMVGYTYDIKSVFNVGLSMSVGGYNQFTAGPFFSVRAGAFRFGLGSGNIAALFLKNTNTGVDFTFNLGLAFR